MLKYWRFYWPLMLTGLAMVLGVQFQNAALARYPEAATELAIFALGYGTFGFFRASLSFIAQLTNIFARSDEATRRCHRFVWLVSIIIVLPLILLGHSDGGATLLAFMYQTDAELTSRVQEYLIYLAPIILLGGQRFFYTGLLIQGRLTGWVTILNLLFLGVEIACLVIGFTLGYSPVLVLVGSESLAILVQIVGTIWVRRRYYLPPSELPPSELPPAEIRPANPIDAEQEHLSYRELFAFFIPVSMTGVMFALSRPLLYAFVSRTPNGLLAIAALRVAFDFSMIFQQAANQFRHFFVTFGIDDLPGKRRFMTLVGLGITAFMLLFAVTPLSDLVWSNLMKIPDNVRALSVQAFLIMCLMPAVIIIRNYYHGLLMVARRTSGMALGSILRVVAIYFGAQFCYGFGWLNHLSASVILILGFVVETLVVLQVTRKGQAERDNATAKM